MLHCAPLDPMPLPMRTPDPETPRTPSGVSADHFPEFDDEIKDLLASEDWEEVNQGLELLVSSLGNDEIQPFGSLIDAAALRVMHPDPWQSALGIGLNHEINAVAKLAELTGALTQLRSIRLNNVSFADEIQIDLTLLSGALALEELIINGGTVTGLSGLSALPALRNLALVVDSIDWDIDEHGDLFSGLTELRSLTIFLWPWEDLGPLAGLNQLERLDLRGGELSTLEGLEGLTTITNLSLSNFYSLPSISEISQLKNLRSLKLSNLGVSSLEPLAGLDQLSAIELETSDPMDVSALGSLPELTTVQLQCSRDLVGLGALSAATKLRELKLSDFPDYSYGNSSSQRFGHREIHRLCMSWKNLQTSSRKVSSLATEGADLPVVLLGLNVLETLAGNIDTDDFSSRLEQLFCRWGQELRSRAYWPRHSASVGRYSQTAPIGQWLNKAAGFVPVDTLDHIAATLAEQLPATPQRL